MKDQWERESAALRAEVAALRQQVRVLAVQQARATAPLRWHISKSMRFVLLPVCMLLAAGGVLYGQSAIDALFIDQQGRVGIGKTDPNATLDVAGTLNVAQKASLAATEVKGTLDVTQKTNLTDTTIKGPLTTEGNVGIGMTGPNAKLQVDNASAAASQALILSNSNTSFAANEGVYQSYYVGGTTGNEMARILAANKTEKVGSHGYLAFSTRNSDSLTEKVRIDNIGNVGVGITDPKAKLHVDDGELRARASHNNPAANIGQFVANNETQGIGIGYNSIQALGSATVPNQDIIVKPKGDGTVYLDGPVVIKGFGEKYKTGANEAYLQLIPYNNDYMAWRKGGTPQLSDERLKIDLRQIPNAVSKVRRLRGVMYHWNARGLQSFTRDIESSISAGPDATAEENQKLWQAERDKRYKELAGTSVGIVAQDVEAVLPEAVTTDAEGYKSVRYDYLIPLLIEALKEQDKTVKDQAQVVTQQQQEIAQLTAATLIMQRQIAGLASNHMNVTGTEGIRQATETGGLSCPTIGFFE